MSNYNSTLQSNNTDLQAILDTINELPNAGGSDPVLQDKTVTPSTSQQYIQADVGYDGLDTVTVNAMPTTTQATPSITINASGLITATATQTAGYVSAGSKSATKQLAFQAAKTITPSTTSQIAVSSGYYTGGNVMVAGDSDLVAGNIKSGVSIFGVTGTYVGSGGSSGNASDEDGLVARTLSTYTNDKATYIGSYAFYNYFSLTSVNFPAAISIGGDAFYCCTSLTSVSFPAAISIGNSAFTYCSRLTSVSFPTTTSIGSFAFAYCSNLTSVNFPAATSISKYAFYYCSYLTSVSFPTTTSIGSFAFGYCSNNLTSISFPAATYIGDSAFYYCFSLTSVNFPAATYIGGSAFTYCSRLTSVSFPAAISIGGSAFYRCSKLTSIYLTNSKVCKLSNSNAFSGTGISSATGSIFVPSSLVASYKAATNWVFFSNRIYSA